MNRFIPDSFIEGLWRPIAMAAPNGWVYIEVIAPDFRFVFLGLLVLLSAAFAWKAGRKSSRAAWALIGLLVVAFVPWLITTGNGRYFIPVLILGGILCVALVHALPVTRSLRLALALLMVGVQGVALWQNNPWGPWNAWGLYEWREPPYYPLQLDAEAREQPATYVTISAISYSLLAPQFPPASRWLNLSALVGADPNAPDIRMANAILTASDRIGVLMPMLSSDVTPQGLPTARALRNIGQMLAAHGLEFMSEPDACRFLPMRGSPQPLRGEEASSEPPALSGFWICRARFIGAPPDSPAPTEGLHLQVFERLERACPRLFPPGQTRVIPLPSGVMRNYGSADMKAYVLRDGGVYYKYHRAMNFVYLGQVEQVLADGFTVHCDQVPGRAGLPWERGL